MYYIKTPYCKRVRLMYNHPNNAVVPPSKIFSPFFKNSTWLEPSG